MAESAPFKEGINEALVREYADALGGLVAGFDGDAFHADATRGLGDLELKARVKQISAQLFSHLGGDYASGLAALMRMLAESDADVDTRPSFQFLRWPMAQYIEDHGVDAWDHFDASFAAMREITKHFSCEFAVRPFLIRDQARAMAVMHDWARDASVHVRRNASEGVRPRLPWGQRLNAFVDDPAPVIALLDVLRKDPEEYVRRSVSNCLNDIAKDHPDVLMDTLERWDMDPDANSAWIKKRALRTLVKAGDPRALGLLGYGAPRVVVEGLTVDADTYRVGDSLTFGCDIVSKAKREQRLMLDYRVHFVKKNGSRTPKVFKLKELTLGPGERVHIERRQHLAPISTRRYYAGEHLLDLQINGRVMGEAAFELLL